MAENKGPWCSSMGWECKKEWSRENTEGTSSIISKGCHWGRPPQSHIKLTRRSRLKRQCTHMGFNNIELINIHNDLVERTKLVVFCALTNERPDFMQVLVVATDLLWAHLVVLIIMECRIINMWFILAAFFRLLDLRSDKITRFHGTSQMSYLLEE